VKQQVDKNFMNDEGLLCCPFLKESFLELGKRPVYAHVVPKCEQNILTKKQDVVNHPCNVVPTIGTIHEEMELHTTPPGFTLDYLRPHPCESEKCIFVLRLAPHIKRNHVLLKFVSAHQEVIMPSTAKERSTCSHADKPTSLFINGRHPNKPTAICIYGLQS